jgi:uncharacterized protein (TIGR02600 family)
MKSSGGATPFNALFTAFLYRPNPGSRTELTKEVPIGRVSTNPTNDYQFVSRSPIEIKDPNGKMGFNGGRFEIEIWTVDDRLVQTIKMKFPEVHSLPLPTVMEGDKKAEGRLSWSSRISSNELRDIIQRGDVVRSVEAIPDGPARGDLRIYAALKEVPESYFNKNAAQLAEYRTASKRFVHGLRLGAWTAEGQFGFHSEHEGIGDGSGNQNHRPDPSKPVPWMPTEGAAGYLVKQSLLPVGSEEPTRGYRRDADPAVPRGLDGAFQDAAEKIPGDWDNMTGPIEDGPYINKPDEGNSATVGQTEWVNTPVIGGYYTRGPFEAESGKSFSPNRQISSAVAFGSLPTGINPSNPGSQRPWRTLLFCAVPPGAGLHEGHGSAAPDVKVEDRRFPYSKIPDHLYLDLFTMPIVEPYAISEPFSTAGKINMNYQILPFNNITRATGVHAVLKATQMLAIPTDAANRTSVPSYKDGYPYPKETRYEINPTEQGTLFAFKARFDQGRVFRSASEICEVYLVPQHKKKMTASNYPNISLPTSYLGVPAWWDRFKITGDNTREIPYGHIYPRLTTKSNTFTVHMRVQALRKASAAGGMTSDQREKALADLGREEGSGDSGVSGFLGHRKVY